MNHWIAENACGEWGEGEGVVVVVVNNQAYIHIHIYPAKQSRRLINELIQYMKHLLSTAYHFYSLKI